MTTTNTTNITIEQVGRRLYFRNAPYAAKDALRDAGAKWDRDERAWWMGSQRRAEAEAVLAGAQAAVARAAVFGRYVKVGDAWCVLVPTKAR
jgi:hypothetical protein